MFLTTKVPCCPAPWGAGCNKKEFSGSITEDIALNVKILGTIDLVLLHWTCDTVEQTLAAWLELETALAAGHTRAIGISNANATMLAEMLPRMKVKPAVNQCGHSIGAHNASHNPTRGGGDDTLAFCREHGISYSAYSPLGGLDGLNIFKNPVVIKVAHDVSSRCAHEVSPAQVALRWLVQQDITVVTSADELDYIKEDLDVFSFSLTPAEMTLLAAV